MASFIITLPTFGKPYIVKQTDDIALKDLQSVVGGCIEGINTKAFSIHPMFRKDKRWDLAASLLTRTSTKVYVNEDGLRNCSPNMATILARAPPTGCPHLCGDIALVVPASALENPAVLTLRKNKDGETLFEFDEDEEIEAFQAEADANGWDYISSTGQVFEAKFPEPKDEGFASVLPKKFKFKKAAPAKA